MSAQDNQKGIISVIIVVVVLLLLVGGAAWVYFQKDKIPWLMNKSTQTATLPSADPKETEGWQSYLVKYGQIRIKYPQDWLVRANTGLNGVTQYTEFLYSKQKGVISDQSVISINVGKIEDVYFETQYLQKNFVIPSLGSEPNAYYSQTNGPWIYFTHEGIAYLLYINTDAAIKEGLEPGQAINIFTAMARSITFEDVASSCEESVLKPLADFPSDFVLANYHGSGEKKINTYWPNVIVNDQFSNSDPLPPPPSFPPDDFPDKSSPSASFGSRHVFVVTYQKDGAPFKESDNFRQTVVEIAGGNELFGSDDSTLLYNVNCPELLTSGKTQTTLKIGHTQKSPFDVEIFGKASNATELWGVSVWNLNLLKKTRNEVYIKRGDTWQKYTAKNYYVTN